MTLLDVPPVGHPHPKEASGSCRTALRQSHKDSFLPSGREGRSRTRRGHGPRASRQAASSKVGPEGKDGRY